MKLKGSEIAEFWIMWLLTIAFYIGKTTNYLDWSWHWVLSPLWIEMVLSTIIMLIGYSLGYVREDGDWVKK